MKKLTEIDKFINTCLKSEPEFSINEIGTSKAESLYSAFNPIKSNNEIKKKNNFTFVFPNRSKFFMNHKKIKNFSFNFENSKKLDISFSNSEEILIEKEVSNLNKLKNLKKIIIQIFKGEFEDFQLKRYEIKILFFILQKKFKIQNLPISEKELELSEISDLKKKLEIFFFKIQENKCLKRNEEKNKFIYKLTMKSLKDKYYKKYGRKKNCYDEKRFYEHYFKNLVNKLNLDITEFYDPLNQKTKKKCLNNSYFQLIFSEKLFYKDFFDIVENILKNKIFRSHSKKFEKILSQYESFFENVNFEDAINNILKKIKESKRIKFPWNNQEIDTAIHFFCNHIKILTKKNILKV